MEKREKLEIIRDILIIIRDNHCSIKPTPLLRKSNLSSQRFMEYIEKLKEKEFVKERMDKKGKREVIITDKGMKYLEKYQVIMGFIEEFEL